MTMTATVATDGVDGFIADLECEGLNPNRDGEVVYYDLVPVTGPHTGSIVRTGVTVSELGGWPATPPHWIHLSDSIKFTQSNIDTQFCLPGWCRHSRDTGEWNLTRPAIQVWLAHARGVLGAAL